MDCAVVYSEESLSDLREITAFISADSREIAEAFANRLVDLAESLRRMPQRGRPVKGWADVRVVVLSHPTSSSTASNRLQTELRFYAFGMAQEIPERWSGLPKSDDADPP